MLGVYHCLHNLSLLVLFLISTRAVFPQLIMDHTMDRKILTVVIILSLIYVKCFGYLSKVSKYTYVIIFHKEIEFLHCTL